VHTHPYDLSAPGQIQRVTFVAAVLSPTQLTAPGTRHSHAGGLNDKNQVAVGLDDNQNNAPAL
jgi:hypothetical protein